MLATDIRVLTPAKLATLARHYGLKQQGKRGTWVVRKSVTDPRTHLEHTLKRSTKTADLRTAVLRAAGWVDDFTSAIHGNRLPTLVADGRWASLQQIEQHYLAAATCAPGVRRGNIAQLRAIVLQSYPDALYENTSSDILDGRMVRRWQTQKQIEAEARYLPGDVEACERAKRNANAIYRKARSVFSRRMLQSYEDAGLKLPTSIREFPAQGFLKAAAPAASEQLPDEVLSKIFRLLPRLRQVRPAVWGAFWLMYRGATRNKEVAMSRWRWMRPPRFEGDDYRLVLQTDAAFKPKAKERTIRLHSSVVVLLESLRKPEVERSDDDFIIPLPTYYQRYRACQRQLNKFLRACGVKPVKGKISYRLRGHAITEVIHKYSIHAAKEFAGHTSVKTTEIYQGSPTSYGALPVTPIAL